jgi:hypothetical protein
MVIEDSAAILSLTSLVSDDLKIVAVAQLDNRVLVKFSIPGDPHLWAVEVDLPSQNQHASWIYAPPEDAEDWAMMFRFFLEEEVATGANKWGTWHDEGEFRRFDLEPYGVRRSDISEHERLSKLSERPPDRRV